MDTRCRRCATILRNRNVCPSCGFDAGAAAASQIVAVEDEPQAQAAPAPRRGGKAGMKMCPVCFSSVAEAEMVDHNGQRVCPECQRNLTKPAKE
ncbi:MAG: hypothetical protein KIS92_17995 [Planctomycetota bacterium]|nr:hypothetical protein [Planctomycetota bacterium]